ncbi:MAG: hypothetical protein KatS3mg076_1099 [Candidatus Binatia bacterium]|nr:MAG: hypothetical protein KatS3mg076_1099 [Candidatus Binatia bacterium]
MLASRKILFGALALCFVVGCGSDDDDLARPNIAFTPLPTATPVPKLCGNGVVDEEVGEECDAAGGPACSEGRSCVCCVCLGPGEELGVREFTVERPGSTFESSITKADVWLTGRFLPGPIRLRAGRPDPNLPGEEACTAPLVLDQDVILGFPLIDGSVLCTKIFAEGSRGAIDCDGGTAHDVLLTQDSKGDEEEDPAISDPLRECEAAGNTCFSTFDCPSGDACLPKRKCPISGEECSSDGDCPVGEVCLGDAVAAGPGAASFEVARLVTINLRAILQPPPRPEDCLGLDYDDPFDPEQVQRLQLRSFDILVTPSVFTTERATGVVFRPKQEPSSADRVLDAGRELLLCCLEADGRAGNPGRGHSGSRHRR